MPRTRAHAVMRFFTDVSKHNVDGNGGSALQRQKKSKWF
jgi:hypothetical protein